MYFNLFKQSVLFEFWINLVLHLKQSLLSPISIGYRQRCLACSTKLSKILNYRCNMQTNTMAEKFRPLFFLFSCFIKYNLAR